MIESVTVNAMSGVKSSGHGGNPRLAIVLPAYNEQITIEGTIEAFHAAAPDAEIHVVDNNSSDATRSIATKALLDRGIKGSVIAEPRQGKGNAVRRAFLDIDADVYVLSDADLTYPADRIHDLIRPVLDGEADMVVGDRRSGGQYASENKRRFHNFGNRLVQTLVNRLFHSRLVDIMSGYRALSRGFVKSYPILVEGFQIETDMTLHALHRRMRIREIEVEYRDRPAGSVSKLNTLADGARVISTIAQILRFYRPLAFFSVLSALFASAGLLVAIPVFRDWLTSGYIEHVPSAVLAAALEIVAFSLLGVGLVLDSVAYHERRGSELHYLSSTASRREQV
jgi:glycosyltransferase involved in cell wall biosynthesis